MLKIVCLPVARKTEEDEALFQQELGRVQRETEILKACVSPFVVKLSTVAPRLLEIAGHTCFAYSEELLSGSDLGTVIELSSGTLAPYLAATGADAVASGWFGTLKCFSLKKV